MIFDAAGGVEGSVTGGCIEAALAGEAEAVLAGAPPRLLPYGISDELAGTVGLMCGGNVEVLVRQLDEEGAEVLEALRAAQDRESPVALATVLDGPSAGRTIVVTPEEASGRLGLGGRLDEAVAADSRGLLAQGQSLIRRYGSDGTRVGEDVAVFVHAMAPSPRVVVCGAVDFSVAFARLAREVGYRVTICDPRRAFISGSRLQAAAEVVCEWPDAYIESQRLQARDSVLVFTHDSKLDEPALLAAVRTEARYIGALGSRRTHADRLERLRDAGLGEPELERIICPAGLDIGSSTPAETAISILAEMAAVRNGRGGGRLNAAEGPIRVTAERRAGAGRAV